MANTKVLHVQSSDSDYAALSYEDCVKDGILLPEELWEKSYEAQQTLVYEDESHQFEYTAKKFGDVDPKFVEFIRSEVEDYDYSKSNRFYII